MSNILSEAGGPRPAVLEQPATSLIVGLDGLRAISVLGVLFYHAHFGWMRGGFLGVEVFFVISGFLITGLLAKEAGATGAIDLRGFWKRRMLRLYPALLAFLFVAGTLGCLFLGTQASQFRMDLLASLVYLENWYQLRSGSSYFADQGFPLLRHLWSLAVEGQFYVVWPWVVAGLLRLYKGRLAPLAMTTAALAVASCGLMALLADPGNLSSVKAAASLNRVYLGTDTRAFGLLIGALLALTLRPRPTGRILARGFNLLALAALAGLGVVMAFADDQAALLYPWGFLLVDLLTALVITSLMLPSSTWMRTFLGQAPLEWLGKRSYGLYLWHYPVFRLLVPGQEAWPWFLLRLGVTLALTYLSFKYLEEPVRHGAWKRWLLRGPDPAAPAWPWRLGRTALTAMLGLALLEGVTLARRGPYVDPVQEAIRAGAAALDNLTPVAEAAPEPVAKAAPETARASSVVTPVVPVVLPEAMKGVHLTAIGDSVMKGAALSLKKMGEATLGTGMIQINAEESRPFFSALPILQAYKHDNRLGEVVVVHLGTNNSHISEDNFRKLMSVLADTHLVLFLTAKSDKVEACEAVNRALGTLVARYPNARLLDWNTVAGTHPEYFYSDQTHLRPEGAVHYAELILAQVASQPWELPVEPTAKPLSAPEVH
jgi:peptidoglycan/LPS O-acetylase OafA/YrhL